jgi:hypothetical protein
MLILAVTRFFNIRAQGHYDDEQTITQRLARLKTTFGSGFLSPETTSLA